jgi:hypothetical protein
MKPLLPQPGGFEGGGLVREKLPADDLSSVKRPDLREIVLKGNAAAFSATLFVDDEDDARSGIDELLRIEAILIPGTPVVPGALDHRIAPNHDLGKINEAHIAHVPDDVLVKQRPERLYVLKSTSNQLDVLLRHRLRSISRAGGV